MIIPTVGSIGYRYSTGTVQYSSKHGTNSLLWYSTGIVLYGTGRVLVLLKSTELDFVATKPVYGYILPVQY